MNIHEKMIEVKGVDHQLLKLCEELSEFSSALTKYVNEDGVNKEKMFVEYFDVLFCLKYFNLVFNPAQEYIDHEMCVREEKCLNKLNELK